MRLNYLVEGMMTPETMPPSLFVQIAPLKIMGYEGVKINLHDKSRPRYEQGGVSVVRFGEDNLFTAHCYAPQGYGPLLYDLAIEYATEHGEGLVPATGSGHGANTTNSDYVWKRYYESRNDVEKVPYEGGGYRTRSTADIQRPWLYCVYSKKPVFLSRLREQGRIVDGEAKWEMGEYGTYGTDPTKMWRTTQVPTVDPTKGSKYERGQTIKGYTFSRKDQERVSGKQPNAIDRTPRHMRAKSNDEHWDDEKTITARMKDLGKSLANVASKGRGEA
jgi:hypothetical protein